MLAWACPACGDEYRFAVPEGGYYTELEAWSLRLARGGMPPTTEAVGEYAWRLREAVPHDRRWVRLARLLRAWRERAGLTQEGAAHRAGITARDYKRLEAGEPRRKLTNVEKAVRGVAGCQTQMRMLVAPPGEGRVQQQDFAARMKRASRQLSGRLPVLMPVEDALAPADLNGDAAVAVAALGRALVSNHLSEAFLFYAQVIYEVYWCKRLGGTARPDELMAAVIRPVKELIDVFKRCRSRSEREAVLSVVRRGLETFLTPEQLYEAGTRFLLLIYEEACAEEQLATKLGLGPFEPLTKYFTPAEGMLLTMFDRAGPERREVILDALRRIQSWDRRKGEGAATARRGANK
ncbi:MAG: hypothetical protein QOH51_936 [Acidobacteriota bacterium]|nr:hypothetical protein [Acidobacteriota bacterium]